MLKGTIAASVTPLRDGGSHLDEDAIGPLVDFLVAGGVDGILVGGTTGEGILLSRDERQRAAGRFLEAAGGRAAVAVHAGAQTTADTVALSAHAARIGRRRAPARSLARLPPRTARGPCCQGRQDSGADARSPLSSGAITARRPRSVRVAR
jgi:hypothetical protein